MQNVIPKIKGNKASPVSQLISDCRTALRTQLMDSAKLGSLRAAIDTASTQLEQRFDKQKPGWEKAATGDLLRRTAAGVLRVCVEVLSLRLQFVQSQTDGVPQNQIIEAALNSLCVLSDITEYSLLGTNEEGEVDARNAKLLSFESSTHEIQVEACCCFLIDLRKFSPIKVDLIRDWVSAVRSRNAVGHSIRREGYNAGSLLVELSFLPIKLFSDRCSGLDRAYVSSRILGTGNSFPDQTCGLWEWFNNEASQLCADKLFRLGFVTRQPNPVQNAPQSEEDIRQVRAAEPETTSIDVSEVRTAYDQLHRLARTNQQIFANRILLKDYEDSDLSILPERLHELSVENIANSSFPQLKAMCNGDLTLLATTIRVTNRLVGRALEVLQEPAEDGRQVSERLESRFREAVAKINLEVVDEAILKTPLITVRPPIFKSLPQRLLELSVAEVAGKSLTEHNQAARALGHTTTQRFVEYFELVIRDISAERSRGIPSTNVASSFLRFVYAQDRLKKHSGSSLLDQPVSAWLVESDKHLPQKLVDRSIREILSLNFKDLESTKGVGATKVKRLLTIVERGLAAVESGKSGQQSEPDTRRSQHVERRKDTWPEICSRLSNLGLASFPLGRFAESLSDLPRSLWKQPLGLFLERARHEIREMDGIGRQKSEAICRIIERLGAAVPASEDVGFGFRLLAKELHIASSWVEGMLHSDDDPTLRDVAEGFLRPLLRQIECDLGEDVALMVEQRLGIEQLPMTLDGIAETLSITRERVRQITARAAEAIDVRWSEAQFLMDDLFERIRESSENAVLVPLMKRAFDLLVSYTPETNSSIELVVEAWERAGRQKLTPMNTEEIITWASREFPRTPARTVVRWLTSESLSCVDESGRRLWFSNFELDGILHSLYVSNHLRSLSDLVDGSDFGERNLQGRLGRDIRFVEDENKLFGPAAHFGIERLNGIWTVELTPLEKQTLLGETISLQSLAHVVVAGLLQRGIADATCWGVHRFANECVGQLFGAALPKKLSAIVLADLLVKASDGLIRPMRRRRLRWDHEKSGGNAKGKRGWVNFAVEHYGKPVTPSGLRKLLSDWYQDYAAYVVNQLGTAAGEEDDEGLSVVWRTSTVASIPSIVEPASWSLVENGENVSDEIRLLTSRLIKQAKKGQLSKRSLRSIPWMIQLIEFRSYGAIEWTEDNALNHIEEKTCLEAHTDEEDSDAVRVGNDGTASTVVEVDNLLAKFF